MKKTQPYLKIRWKTKDGTIMDIQTKDDPADIWYALQTLQASLTRDYGNEWASRMLCPEKHSRKPMPTP